MEWILTEIWAGLKIASVVIAIIAAVGLTALIIWAIFRQRRNIANFLVPLLRFFRALVTPPLNNWVFLGLCTLSFILFITAIYIGGGEPLGYKALKEMAKPGPESSIVKYYSESLSYFTTNSEKPLPPPLAPKPKTWFWFKWWGISVLATIGFIPLAWWDEFREFFRRIIGLGHEAWDQRAGRHRRRTHPQPQAPLQPQQTPGGPQPQQQRLGGSFWTRFRERFAAALSADMVWEFFESGIRSAIRGLLKR